MPTQLLYQSPDGTKQQFDTLDARPCINISGTTAALGPTALVAAPGAGSRVVVTSFTIQNESATGTTIILRAGGSNHWRYLGQTQGAGLAMIFPLGREWRLPANTALNIVLSGTNSCGYNVQYFIEAA